MNRYQVKLHGHGTTTVLATSKRTAYQTAVAGMGARSPLSEGITLLPPVTIGF